MSNADCAQHKGGVQSGMVVHTCNPSIWEAEQEDLKFKASLDYTVRSCLKQRGREFIVTSPLLFFFLFCGIGVSACKAGTLSCEPLCQPLLSLLLGCEA
jgi:hypothetical protein